MGYFDLPTGCFELLLKKKGRGQHKAEWKNVMMTDRLSPGDIADCFERWSQNYRVEGARYNGRAITPPTNYHWERRHFYEVLGRYATRAEAVAACDEVRSANWKKPKTERLPCGTIDFVQDN